MYTYEHIIRSDKTKVFTREYVGLLVAASGARATSTFLVGPHVDRPSTLHIPVSHHIVLT